MKKKFQITSYGHKIVVIVRVKDEKSREYKNLTRSTLKRIDYLTYKGKHKVTTVMSQRCVDVFIQEKNHG